MSSSVLSFVVIASLALAGAAAGEAEEKAVEASMGGAPIPASVLFRNPTMSQPKLSPDGKHIAFAYSNAELQRVFVRSVDGTESLGLAEFPLEKVRLRWLDRANTGRVILSADAPDPNEQGVQPMVTRIYGVNMKRPRLKWLGQAWGKRGPNWPDTQKRLRDEVISMARADSNNVLLSHVAFGERTPTVSRLNVVSGRLRELEPPRSGLERWHADDEGIVRAGEVLGESVDGKSYTLLARTGASEKLSPVLEISDRTRDSIAFAGFGESPEHMYVFANHQGRRAVFRVSILEKQLGKPVFAHDEYDVTGLYYDAVAGDYVGAEYVADQPTIGFFNKDARNRQASVDHSLANQEGTTTTNRVVSASKDGGLSIVQVSGDTRPPVYYALDFKEKSMNFVFEEQPDVPVAQLRQVQRVDVPTRDGVMLPAYLTLPADTSSETKRMILMLHGGLGARASRRFDPAVQFFASQGYAVLQVNHRGSGGYGRAFAMKGVGEAEVTAIVQNDLADAVTWAVGQGVADPERVVIYGADGGGTIAIAALASSSDLFRAGASYGGAVGREESSSGKSMFEQAGLIKAPILLAHGGRNTDVRIEDAREFAKALGDAGATVETVEFANERKGFAVEANRVDFYVRLLAFFERHLNAQPEPATAPDSAG